MKDKLKEIENKITSAEESYNLINGAGISAGDVKNRIESLLVIARELRAIEEKSSDR